MHSITVITSSIVTSPKGLEVKSLKQQASSRNLLSFPLARGENFERYKGESAPAPVPDSKPASPAAFLSIRHVKISFSTQASHPLKFKRQRSVPAPSEHLSRIQPYTRQSGILYKMYFLLCRHASIHAVCELKVSSHQARVW